MNFTDYLMEQHSKQYVGTKDCMIDDCDEWMQYLGIDEVIEYAEKWHKLENNKKYIPSDGEEHGTDYAHD